jgi:hypothetical protein
LWNIDYFRMVGMSLKSEGSPRNAGGVWGSFYISPGPSSFSDFLMKALKSRYWSIEKSNYGLA